MFKPLVPLDDADPASRFALDHRFWPQDGEASELPSEEEAVDPADRARIEGYQRGWDDAMAQAEQEQRARRDAQDALALSFTRLEADQTARLAKRLRETVETLCHELIADLAIDRELLARRASAAAQLLAGAEDGASLHLHPEDATLLPPALGEQIAITPDPTMARGELRFETPTGGIEDGPGNWRDAVSEALRTC